jgi:hypothetical protein
LASSFSSLLLSGDEVSCFSLPHAFFATGQKQQGQAHMA